MSTIPLHIILHGLIALVPTNGPDGANHMTALLVDARQKPPGVVLEGFAPHMPMLTVTTPTTAECREAGCSVDGFSCTCDLSGHEISISIEPDVQPAAQRLSKRPPGSLPFDNLSANDFSYIANLSQPPLGLTLDTRFLGPTPPDGLVARMSFPFASVKACALGTRPDERGKNVHPMSFRPLHQEEKAGEMSQALAQMLAARLDIPSDGPIPPKVTLTISDFGGANPHSLTVDPGEHGFVVTLANHREDLRPDALGEDGVARDFAWFYQLAQNPPAWSQRLIPHVKYTRWKSVKDIEASECEELNLIGKNPTSRPICPMASFNPGEEEL